VLRQRRLLAEADDLHDIRLDVGGVHTHPGQDFGRHAVGIGREGKEEMFGADVAMTEALCLPLCPDDRGSGPAGETFEHDPMLAPPAIRSSRGLAHCSRDATAQHRVHQTFWTVGKVRTIRCRPDDHNPELGRAPLERWSEQPGYGRGPCCEP
jgi:hypothetical protein